MDKITIEGTIRENGHSYYLLIPLQYIKDKIIDIKKPIFATLTNIKPLPEPKSDKQMIKDVKKGVNK